MLCTFRLHTAHPTRTARRPGARATAARTTAVPETLERRTLFAAGDLDPTFGGGDGIVAPDRAGAFFDVVPLAGGKLLALGHTAGGVYLARLSADGSFDNTFSGDGQVVADLGGSVRRLAIQPDGRIVAFGGVLARFNADGSLDATFGGGDGVATPFAVGEGLALQPDGKILTAEGTRYDGAHVARYNPDGTPDTTFGDAGRVVFDDPIGENEHYEPYDGFVPLDVAWQASTGRIVAGGQTPGFTTFTDFAAVRLLPGGQLDTTFANGLGMATDDTGDIDLGGRIDVAPDGAIVMAGAEEDEDATLVLFSADGRSARSRLLPWFGLGDSSDVSFTPDGKIVIVGDAEYENYDTGTIHRDIHLMRFNADLSEDLTFGTPDVRTDVFEDSDDFPYALTVTPAGDVVVAGKADGRPVLLQYQGAPPRPGVVQEVFVRSSAWRLRPGETGARVDGDFSGVPRTWINLNEIVLRYSRPPEPSAVPRAGTVTLDGVRSDYAVTGVSHLDPRTFVLRLDRPLGALPAGGSNGDRVRLSVPGGAPGGDAYALTLLVLPGEADGRIERVNASDVAYVRARLNRTVGQDGYSTAADVNYDGRINAIDVAAVRARLNSTLPPRTIGVQAATSPSMTRDLFADEPIV